MNDRDKLTGALSRNAFLSQLTESIDIVISNHTTLTLLCANVDNMKRFNMHNGYLLGDEMLKKFVARISPLLGEQQSIFRYGGDSFAIISMNSSCQDVSLLAKEICDDVRQNLSPPQPDNCGHKHCKGPVKVTVSIGVAEIEDNMILESILERADQLMYEAKSAGRDRVHTNCKKICK
jgi:diguanylate cyclase